MTDFMDNSSRHINDMIRLIDGTKYDKETRHVFPWLSGDKVTYSRKWNRMTALIDDMTRFIDDKTRPIDGTKLDKETRFVYPQLSDDKGASILPTGVTRLTLFTTRLG